MRHNEKLSVKEAAHPAPQSKQRQDQEPEVLMPRPNFCPELQVQAAIQVGFTEEAASKNKQPLKERSVFQQKSQ